MRRRYVLGLLVLSGFAGLAYELLWVRLLALSLGSTTLSFSTVLAVFFAGMALGSRWAGKRSTTTRRPLFTYAVLEATTGAFGLILLPLMQHLSAAFALVDPGPGAAGLVARFVVSAVVLLPPTFLMGATLPFICVACIERDDDTGRGTAMIYGFNTLGACLGAYGITFWLLPALGVTQATLFVVGINALVGFVAWRQSSRDDGQAAAPAPAEAASVADDGSMRKLSLVATVATAVGGFVATGAQIVWSRFFGIVLEGTTYGMGSVLVSVLVGIAIGSLLAARLARGRQQLGLKAGLTSIAMVAGLWLFSLALPLFMYLVGVLPNSGLGGLGLLHAQLVLVWAALAVSTIASGASLPLLVAVVEHSAGNAGVTLSRLYAANTLGCIVGSLLVGFVLLPVLGSNQVLFLLAVVLVGITAVFLLVAHGRKVGTVVAALAGFALVGFYPGFDARLMRASNASRTDFFSYFEAVKRAADNTTYFHEGDVATVSLRGETAGSTNVGLQLNGLGQGGRNRFAPEFMFESTLVGAVPWVHSAAPKRGLLVGLGAGVTVKTLLALGVDQVEVIELEKGVVDAVKQLWGDKSPLDDPHLTLVVNDARHHLLVQARRNPHQYDFIASMPAHPWVASSLFTHEFFELAKANLSEQGIFSTWFGVPQMSADAVEALFGAFTQVFPHAVVYWVPEAGAFYLVGSPAPIRFDLQRFEQLAKSEVLVGESEARRSPMFLLSRVTAMSTPEHPATATQQNTDDNARIEFEVRGPRATQPRDLLTYFPLRWLEPKAVSNGDLDATFIELVELQFATPGGLLPVIKQASPATVRRMLPGLREGLSPDVALYAEARTLMQEGKLADAATVAEKLTRPELKARAAKFLAAFAPDAERVEKLKAVSATPGADVLAQLTSWGESEVPKVSVDERSDALGFLYLPQLPQPERGEQTAKISARVLRYQSSKLDQRCVEVAKRDGWVELQRVCEQALQAATRAEAQALVSEAMRVGDKGDLAAAIAGLRRAHALAPLTEPQLLTLVRAAVVRRDQAAVDFFTEVMLARGHTAPTVQSMVADAQRLASQQAAAPP